MLLMMKKRIRGGIYYAIHIYAETNNKYIMIKALLNHHNLCISIQIICVDGQCHKNCL